ncbi:MAG: cadherin-like domain-containing protein [Myxococcales bacterium]|nr:cadherin-like domain-containing protein [Myxococcales bacterium]
MSLGVLLSSLVGLSSSAAAAPISPDKTYDLPPPNLPYKPPPPKFIAPPADGFYWSAEPRAHKWAEAWRPLTWPEADKVQCTREGDTTVCRKPEQTYDPNYVHPKSFNILVSGCVDEQDWELTQAGKPTKRTYKWTSEGRSFVERRCERALSFPAQGSYKVELRVDGKSFTQSVRVRDILIVALGDSMSSGEGAPDVYQFLGTPHRPASWVDRQCHRSKHAPAAQAAMAIEKMDPQTSVTFISFACSGASLDTNSRLSTSMWNGYTGDAAPMSGSGVLGPYAGIESPLGDAKMDIVEYREGGGFGVRLSQVDQLKTALEGKRRADVIVMSAGINDANFAAMMHTCALYSDCPEERVGSAASKMPLKKRFAWDAQRVTDMYRRLGKELDPLAKRVLVLQYPNAFTGDNKQTCDETLEDVALAFMPQPLRLGITAYEANWIQKLAGPTLHNAIAQGVSAAGFEFIQGPWDAFRGHGYCASLNNRWVNRAVEANNKQGPSVGDTKGTIHPNWAGHRELSKFVVNALVAKENNTPPRPRSDAYSATSGKVLRVDAAHGVLANDSDPDIINTLVVKSHTQPSSRVSKVQVERDGSFGYHPVNFTGTESFFYTVTDGVSEMTGRVVITVAPNPAGEPGAPKVNFDHGPLMPKP